jgi:hypothetical protein
MTTRTRRLLITCLLAVGATAFGAVANPAAQQLVQAGGAMQAAAETCDSGYTEAQLAESKTQQRGLAVQMGLSEARFEQVFEAAYMDARAKLAALSAQDRADACRQLEQMPAR